MRGYHNLPQNDKYQNIAECAFLLNEWNCQSLYFVGIQYLGELMCFRTIQQILCDSLEFRPVQVLCQCVSICQFPVLF